MRGMRSVAVAVVTALCAWPAMAQVTLLEASRIDTMEPARPRGEGKAFDAGGEILAVGQREQVRREFPDARRIDVGQATVIPGLIDAHGLMLGLGMSGDTADLVGT